MINECSTYKTRLRSAVIYPPPIGTLSPFPPNRSSNNFCRKPHLRALKINCRFDHFVSARRLANNWARWYVYVNKNIKTACVLSTEAEFEFSQLINTTLLERKESQLASHSHEQYYSVQRNCKNGWYNKHYWSIARRRFKLIPSNFTQLWS